MKSFRYSGKFFNVGNSYWIRSWFMYRYQLSACVLLVTLFSSKYSIRKFSNTRINVFLMATLSNCSCIWPFQISWIVQQFCQIFKILSFSGTLVNRNTQTDQDDVSGYNVIFLDVSISPMCCWYCEDNYFANWKIRFSFWNFAYNERKTLV